MRTLFFSLLLLGATPAVADHPGDDLNFVMAGKEAAFEPLEPQAALDLALVDAEGRALDAGDVSGRILAVSFAPGACGAPCAAQQAQLAEVLASLNDTPMRDMVSFVTVSDSAETAEGRAPDNWITASPADGRAVSDLRDAFGQRSERPGSAPMIHLLDRDGRQVGIFHGSGFQPMNLLLYINGLTNRHPTPEPAGLLERMLGWLR
ncbi:SCO family protein [Tranquillimonas alkanivorans]|uniref:Protein SCO1/2 n=1 Tax=Tranquillimonas alkanivorans TaxID=441119 RepID=A0A1I5TMG7_9RHOB|nr:hypothetical protein [Tranquillimonas alkanivorans]SFP84249.1 protein SCO1/2 [Tranquillimonas alkanivorans]